MRAHTQKTETEDLEAEQEKVTPFNLVHGQGVYGAQKTSCPDDWLSVSWATLIYIVFHVLLEALVCPLQILHA